MKATVLFLISSSIGIIIYGQVGTQIAASIRCIGLKTWVTNALTHPFRCVSDGKKERKDRVSSTNTESAQSSSRRHLNSHSHSNSDVLKNSFSWHQVGQDINGEAQYDSSGYSVDMSSDGKRVIIGADLNDGNGDNSGHARVFEQVNGTDWRQVGGDIDGEAPHDRAGGSVAMSSNGKRVIVGSYNNNGNGKQSGHARVFEEVEGKWEQVGRDIDGEEAEDWSGESVDMSSDGKRVIIGARYNDSNGEKSGHARIFAEVHGEWIQVGDDISGEKNGDKSGFTVAINSNGRRVIVGAYHNDGNGSNSGHARVFEELNGRWLQIGNDIDGESAADESGTSVDISADGKRVIVGAPKNDGNGDFSGHARIFEEINAAWVQVGEDINGEAKDDRAGFSVSMDDSGKLVIIGAFNNDGNGDRSGHARIFAEVGNIWSQVGHDINGERTGDTSGSAVGISSDGERVIIGAMQNDGNGHDAGHCRVFYLSTPMDPSASPSSIPSPSPSKEPSSDAKNSTANISTVITAFLFLLFCNMFKK